MLNFTGTAYLGLDRHPQMLDWVKEGLHIFGTHYGGSRRSNWAPDIFMQAEQALAQWTGAPAALIVSSGTTAAQLITRFLAGQNYHLSYSPNTHPALWWPQSETAADWKSWWQAIRGGASKQAFVADAVDPLRVIRPDWSQLSTAATDSILCIDDSHWMGIGVQGNQSSWKDLRTQWSGELLITASLGKAWSLPAGVILGSLEHIEQLRQLPQFGGASPPAPAYVFAWLKAAGLIRLLQQQLQQNIRILSSGLDGLSDLSSLPQYPVWRSTHNALAPFLAAQGIGISHFHYPTATDPLYTRIVLKADHQPAHIQQLLAIMQDFLYQNQRP